MTRASRLHRLLRGCALLMLVAAPPAVAQQQAPTDALRQIGSVEADVRAIDRALDTRVDDERRDALRDQARAAQEASTSAAEALTDRLALLDARVKGLGPVPPQGEAADVARQRAALSRERAAVDAAIRRGGLARVEAGQLIDELDRSEAEQFTETISTRGASPLTPAFWSGVVRAAPRDLRRIDLFVGGGLREARRRSRDHTPWPALLGVLLAVALLLPIRPMIHRIGQRYLIDGAPGHRIRRSGYALWRVLTGTLLPLLAAVALVEGMRWSGLVAPRWDAFLDGFVGAAGFAGFTGAVTGAVLMRSQPSWRIAPIDDEAAGRLRPLSWCLAALAFGSLLLMRFNEIAGASQAATDATEAIICLLHLVLIGAFLLALGRIRVVEREEGGDDKGSYTTRAGLGVVELAAWTGVLVSAVSLLIGYIGLALVIVQGMAWLTVLGCATFITVKGADDLLTSILSRDSRSGHLLIRGVGLRGSTVDQAGLLLSGIARLLIVVVAISLLVSPFGAGGGVSTLFGRLGLMAQGVDVGGVSVSPGSILRGVVVLAIGLALVRAFMAWLDTRYLPVTDLDGSSRNSISLVTRYVGIALAVIWSLASLGIGVERIALLLSALSVGIGFGLQAITSNFVSGLILLAERPIKIGDLIRVGTDEGDVKRISVRSTEIELPDHSTLIVPNSELITKTVLNKTRANPLGRVQVQFSVPIDVDVAAVRQLLLDSYAQEDAVLDDPAPVAFIDSIVDGRVLFNSFGHVAGPRAAYGARSNIYLRLLAELRARGVEIGTVPQRLELVDERAPRHD